MENILVTGGNGQLGKSLEKIAGDYPGYRFIFTDLPATDINDRAAIEHKIANFRINWIINCAAYTHVDAAEREPEEAFRANCEGPRLLAGVAAEHGVKLIHISTDYVFGKEKHDTPYNEKDKPAPLGIYGESKLAGEKAIEQVGCDAVIIRTAWLYSEFGKNFIKTMFRLSRLHDKIEVVNDQYGSPTYATDLARAVMAVIARGVTGFDIYHYSNEGCTTWYEFAREAFRLAKQSVNLHPISGADYRTVAKRPDYSVLDTTKIRKLGAVIPRWQESLAECLVELGEKEIER